MVVCVCYGHIKRKHVDNLDTEMYTHQHEHVSPFFPFTNAQKNIYTSIKSTVYRKSLFVYTFPPFIAF